MPGMRHTSRHSGVVRRKHRVGGSDDWTDLSHDCDCSELCFDIVVDNLCDKVLEKKRRSRQTTDDTKRVWDAPRCPKLQAASQSNPANRQSRGSDWLKRAFLARPQPQAKLALAKEPPIFCLLEAGFDQLQEALLGSCRLDIVTSLHSQ